MNRRVLILGSTGSIGTQALDAIQQLNCDQERFEIVGLAAGQNIERLAEQANGHPVPYISISDPALIDALRSKLQRNPAPEILAGDQAVIKLIERSEADLVVNGIVGAAALRPTLKALELGIDIAMANKESLVIGGKLIHEAVLKSPSKMIPVDSEHNALFQLMENLHPGSIQKILVTASGGALRDFPIDQIDHATPEQVLKHPNWAMGQRITVDSATLVNKAFELIEAKWHFDFEWNQIEAIVHPQSIIHGMVVLKDGSIHAHMGVPDMRVPIQHALMYPDVSTKSFGALDLTQQPLEFNPVDPKRYPAFEVVMESGRMGGTAPAVINAADEIAVERFLTGEIPFGRIAELLGEILEAHQLVHEPSVDLILEADHWARDLARTR